MAVAGTISGYKDLYSSVYDTNIAALGTALLAGEATTVSVKSSSHTDGIDGHDLQMGLELAEQRAEPVLGDDRMLTSYDVVPPGWSFWQIFEGDQF